ncbi:hypothetical protein [Capnocytophaga sp.]|uniref:hypothetical protein n=1 Tax=Capnocytophaga sp. TaxID=44737 RepID=UPI0026DA7E07|nr:hypothetical protein [Capnocytophaga sp.]MDO5106123.1 hypothetical protein [Capnocytophaga sp.]
MEGQNTEFQSANLLLKKGVRIQLLAPFLWIFKRKKSLVLTAPTLETLLKVARLYLTIPPVGKEVGTTEAMGVMALHGKTVSLILAVTLRNGKEGWLTRLLARSLRKSLSAEEIFYLFQLVVIHGGVQDFIATIRYIGERRITAPILSQNEETS